MMQAEINITEFFKNYYPSVESVTDDAVTLTANGMRFIISPIVDDCGAACLGVTIEVV